MKTKLYIILCGLLLIMPTTSILSAVEINPETIDIELVGGDSASKNITISNIESYSINCKITTIILPDGDGINVSYKYKNFNITSDFWIPAYTMYQIEMIINTSMALEPNVYSIETNLEFVNQEEIPINPSSDDDDDSSWFYYTDTPNETLYPTYVNTTIDDNETIPDNENDTIVIDTETPLKISYFKIIIFIIAFAIFVILMLLYVIKKEKRNQKEKRKK